MAYAGHNFNLPVLEYKYVWPPDLRTLNTNHGLSSGSPFTSQSIFEPWPEQSGVWSSYGWGVEGSSYDRRNRLILNRSTFLTRSQCTWLSKLWNPHNKLAYLIIGFMSIARSTVLNLMLYTDLVMCHRMVSYIFLPCWSEAGHQEQETGILGFVYFSIISPKICTTTPCNWYH